MSLAFVGPASAEDLPSKQSVGKKPNILVITGDDVGWMVARPRRAKWAAFETRWLTAEKNLSALADLSGRWIDCVYARRPPRSVVLDMDSSVSPTHGE